MFAEYVIGWSLPAFIFLLVGLGLLIFEMFIPGFGVAGILGTLSLIVAIALRADSLQSGLLTTAIIFIVLIIAGGLVFRSATRGRISRSPIILKERERAVNIQKELPVHIGQVGVTINMLRPSGNVDFEGHRLDVTTSGEFIEKGRLVRVESISGRWVTVKEIKTDITTANLSV